MTIDWHRPPSQDMPPKGGFPKVHIDRHTPPRGPPGWAIWIGGFGIVFYGFKNMMEQNRRQNAVHRERVEAQYCLLPFMMAEQDVQMVQRNRMLRQLEENTMSHVKGWKSSMDVYKTGIYHAPNIETSLRSSSSKPFAASRTRGCYLPE